MFWQVFLQCSFSLWKIFVLREIEVCISCGDADKANFVPEAFKLWGGKKKRKEENHHATVVPVGHNAAEHTCKLPMRKVICRLMEILHGNLIRDE